MEEERDRRRRADGVGHRLGVGIQSVEPLVVPGQSDQLPERDVGDRDHQPITLLRGQARIVDREVGERADPVVGQAVGHPPTQRFAPVDAVSGQRPERGAEHRNAFDEPRVEELAVVDAGGEIFELGGRQSAGLGGGRQHRTDQRSGGGARDALRQVTGLHQRRSGTGQGDALHSAAGEHQVRAQGLGHAGGSALFDGFGA